MFPLLSFLFLLPEHYCPFQELISFAALWYFLVVSCQYTCLIGVLWSLWVVGIYPFTTVGQHWSILLRVQSALWVPPLPDFMPSALLLLNPAFYCSFVLLLHFSAGTACCLCPSNYLQPDELCAKCFPCDTYTGTVGGWAIFHDIPSQPPTFPIIFLS